MKKLITIFGPSTCLPGESLYQSAEILGILLGEAGFGIVNGGYGGVMEAVSKGAHSTGSGVIGITAEVYFARGREKNDFVTKEISVKSAVDRLMELLDLADAYIAIGISPGTLIEVATAWEYMLKHFTEEKPLILVGSEWKELCITLFAQPAYNGKEHFVTFAETVKDAVDALVIRFGIQEKLPELRVVG